MPIVICKMYKCEPNMFHLVGSGNSDEFEVKRDEENCHTESSGMTSFM